MNPARPWVRIALGASALVLVPLIIALVVLAAKFNGLGVNLAMEHAQIARRVAAGDGLSTDALRPISLAIHGDFRKHPDLYHAPGHPLLLGLVFAVFHASDRAAAALGLLLWMATVILTFWLARRRFGTAVAALAAAFVLCNVSLLKAAVLGMPYPLCAFLLLLYAAVAVPPPRVPEDVEPGSDLRTAVAGALAALAAMTHYLLFFFAPIAALHLAASRRRKDRALLVFAAGFLALTLPWMIRNFVWGRSPFFSFYWYEALAGTETYPGDSVWRSMAAASTGPWEFAFVHPLQMFRKVCGGLLRLWQEALPVADPVVAFLFAAALFQGRAWGGWLLATTAGAAVSVGASAVFRAEPELLLAWTPLLAIPAAAWLVEWLSERVEQVSLRRTWSFRLIPALFREPDILRVVLRRAAAGAVLAVVGFPLFHYLWIYRAESFGTVPDAAALSQSIPPEAVVMTDQPALVAWRGGRRAIWLPLEVKDWDAIESRGARIDAAYVTPLLPNSKAAWWWWIATPRGVYRDLAPVDAPRLPGVLRLRK